MKEPNFLKENSESFRIIFWNILKYFILFHFILEMESSKKRKKKKKRGNWDAEALSVGDPKK
jgi:hypothetical protein